MSFRAADAPRCITSEPRRAIALLAGAATLVFALGSSAQPDAPTATMPIAAETWTMGDDIDGDVLAAYLESRRRS